MSDFWADLQAWTQAQVNAAFATAARARQKSLARDINKLLRDRIAKGVTIKDGKAIAAEFLRTGGRIVPEYVLDLGPVEHGWMTGTAPDWIVYTWSSLAVYLTGRGISIGGSGEYSSLISGRVTPTAEYDDPETYSGLMRLFVQSIIGAGRHVIDVMPLADPPYDGQPYWQFGPELPQVGLMRASDKSYWLIKQVLTAGTAACGIYAVQLEFPAGLADLIALANGGTLSHDMQEYADAWILSQAVQPTTATIRILSRADFLGFLGDSFSGRLAYRQQKRGASDEMTAGAAGVSNRSPEFDSSLGRYRYDTRQLLVRHATLTITWPSGIPSAAISVDTEGYSNEFGQINDTYNLGEGSIVYATRTATFRTQYFSDAYLATDPERTGEKVYASWWGEDGAEKKVIHIDAQTSPGDVTSSTSGAATLDLGTVSVVEGYPTLAPVDKGSTYLATRQLYGWIVAGHELSTVSYTISDIGETVAVEMSPYSPTGWQYDITYTKTLRESFYTWHGDSVRPEIHLVMGPPGLCWLVRRGYTWTVTIKTYQTLTTAYYTGANFPPEEPKSFSSFVCPIATYTASPTLISTVTESEAVTPAEGYVINGATVTPMAESDVNALCDLVDTMHGTTYTSSTRVRGFPGYNGRVNIKYLALSAGLDPDVAALAGRWIGAA